MKLLEKMTYRQWQKRNSELFNSLNKEKQQQARKKGYHNIGWGKVQKSWNLLQSLDDNIVSLFEHELNKGNLIKAIDLAILEGEKGKKLAQEGLQNLEKIYQQLDEMANETLAKYPLL